jgi:hypothetical protein
VNLARFTDASPSLLSLVVSKTVEEEEKKEFFINFQNSSVLPSSQ